MGTRIFSFMVLAAAATELVAAAAVYHVRGVVLELRPETKTAVIRHEPVPGLMPEMTMPFVVPAEEDFAKLSANDLVEFELIMDESGSFARAFKVTGKAVGSKDDPDRAAGDTSSARQAPRLEEGSTVPEVQLTAQDGTTTALRDDAGRFTLLTFIFTRCPVPEFCPLISNRFAQLHGRLDEAELHDQVRLLSITIDPEFDTPEVLRGYGESLGADFDRWGFATAEPEEIDFIASAFRLYRERNGARLDHALCTALVSPDGEILEIWRGNGWTTDAVFDRIEEAVGNRS